MLCLLFDLFLASNKPKCKLYFEHLTTIKQFKLDMIKIPSSKSKSKKVKLIYDSQDFLMTKNDNKKTI